MSFLDSLGSFASNLLSSASEFISSSFEKVGSIVADTTKVYLNLPETVLEVVGKLVHAVAVLLGIVKPEDTPEEMGAKAEQAEKMREDFESDEEYFAYLRDEVELPEGFMENIEPHERLGYRALGSSLIAKRISDQMGTKVDDAVWVVSAVKEFKANEVVSIIEKFKDEKLPDGTFGKYIDRTLDPKDNLKTFDTLFEAFKAINKNMTDNEISDKVSNLQKK